MRVTRTMLEETNEFLRDNMALLTRKNLLLEDQVKLLNNVINLYARTPSLLIATERITEALTRTIERLPRLGQGGLK